MKKKVIPYSISKVSKGIQLYILKLVKHSVVRVNGTEEITLKT